MDEKFFNLMVSPICVEYLVRLLSKHFGRIGEMMIRLECGEAGLVMGEDLLEHVLAYHNCIVDAGMDMHVLHYVSCTMFLLYVSPGTLCLA